MTIFKYHYGAQITVATDDGEAFRTDIGGDGIDDMPIHEITRRIENTVSLLEDQFPDAAFNIGLNFGFTGSGIGEPQVLSDEDKSILRDYAASLEMGEAIPAPAGNYQAMITGASQNADGSTTIEFRVADFDMKGANVIQSLFGKPFPFNLAAAIYDAPVPDSCCEKAPEDIAKDQERQRREKLADEFHERNRTARDAMASLEPTPKGYSSYRLDAANEINGAAWAMAKTTGAPYDRCVALVLNMIRTEGAHGR